MLLHRVISIARKSYVGIYREILAINSYRVNKNKVIPQMYEDNARFKKENKKLNNTIQ